MYSHTFMRDGLEATINQAFELAVQCRPKTEAPTGFMWRPQVKVLEDSNGGMSLTAEWVAVEQT